MKAYIKIIIEDFRDYINVIIANLINIYIITTRYSIINIIITINGKENEIILKDISIKPLNLKLLKFNKFNNSFILNLYNTLINIKCVKLYFIKLLKMTINCDNTINY